MIKNFSGLFWNEGATQGGKMSMGHWVGISTLKKIGYYNNYIKKYFHVSF
jgi:hypothetical protein